MAPLAVTVRAVRSLGSSAPAVGTTHNMPTTRTHADPRATRASIRGITTEPPKQDG